MLALSQADVIIIVLRARITRRIAHKFAKIGGFYYIALVTQSSSASLNKNSLFWVHIVIKHAPF